MPQFRIIVVVFVILLCCTSLSANNLQISNVSLVNKNTVDKTVDVRFTISWNNSWRTSLNWDAAWVFVKFTSGPNDGYWQHASLSSDSTEHTPPSGAAVSVGSTDNVCKGVFLYRSSNGGGTANFSNVRLQWLYGADNLADDDEPVVRVFGIEMVYVPEGSYELGDRSLTGAFRQDTASVPALISTQGQVIKVTGANPPADDILKNHGIWLDGDDGINATGTTATISNADYPTGYKAFYCMKHEISQGQYAEFLNLVGGYSQPNSYSYRYTIFLTTTGTFEATRPERACNYISWLDGIRYADWASLRPMTELEYEKACRGPEPASLTKYPWGNADAVSIISFAGVEDGTEKVSTIRGANCCKGDVQYTNGDRGKGPVRCGIFATISTDRVSSGASYYGILEMAGNVFEQCVTFGNIQGRSFEGSHGDGDVLTTVPQDWPVTIGGGLRGGSWSSHGAAIRVSQREDALVHTTYRNRYEGFRCVRTAP